MNITLRPILNRLVKRSTQTNPVSVQSFVSKQQAGTVEKIKDIATFSSTKVGTPIITDLESLNLKSFVPVTKLNPRDIKDSSLALVHMTKYEPTCGRILSTKEAMINKSGVGATRDTVHFTLNHPVNAHGNGDWNEMPFAVIMPYKSTRILNGAEKKLEGLPNDLYFHGGVNIPSGSIIIKHNPQMQSGQVKLSDYPDCVGVRLLETGEMPRKIVKPVLEKLGYTYADTSKNSLGVWDNCIQRTEKTFVDGVSDNYKSWTDFCKTQGIQPMLHTCSTEGRVGQIIEGIDMLALSNSWKLPSNSFRKTNYKKIFLSLLKDMEKNTKNGSNAETDIAAIRSVIKAAETPKEALAEIKTKLNTVPLVDRSSKSCSSSVYDTSLYNRFGKDSGKILDEAYEFYTGKNIDKNYIADLIKDDLIFL